MDKKELIIAGIVVIIAVIVAGIIFAPSGDDAKYTMLDILNKGDFGENSTIYVKLTGEEKTALSGKEIHVKLTDKKGKVVYDKSVKTQSTGVALAKLENVAAGEYTLNVTFDGDENYSASSISQKITVKGEVVEDVVENNTLIEQTIQDAQDSGDTTTYTLSQSSTYTPSYSQSQSSSSSSSSSDSSDSGGYYDENGNSITPEYDENGNEMDPTTDEG